MKGGATATPERPHTPGAPEASDRARAQRDSRKGLPPGKTAPALAGSGFFWGDAQHPCGFAAGTAREAETSTMLTGETAPPKGEERPYLPLTARTAVRGGSAERGRAWLPGEEPAERTGAGLAAVVPGSLSLPLMEPPGGASLGYPHLPRALQAHWCAGLSPGRLELAVPGAQR